MNKLYTAEELNTWTKCKKLYEFKYVHKLYIPEPLNKYETGLSIHKLLDYQAKGLAIEKLLETATEEIRHIWQILQHSDIVKQPVLKSELSFQCKIPELNRWISGRIDRVIQRDTHNYQIIDWKTGQEIHKNPQTNWQTILYLYGLVEISQDLGLNIQPEQVSFLYFKTTEPIETIFIPYNTQRHKEVKDQIIHTIQEIEANATWHKLNPCNNLYCNYIDICKPNITPLSNHISP